MRVTDEKTIEKLKKLVKVSKAVTISQMANLLKIKESELNDQILDWADQFGFTIDKDTVEFGSGRKEDFLASLDNAFSDWGTKVETKEGKLDGTDREMPAVKSPKPAPKPKAGPESSYEINLNFEKCAGDAACRDVCPFECFDDPVSGKTVIKDNYECIGCEACANSCPNEAITIHKF